MKVLITGASGFIGSFIVEEALRRGFDTWAAMRKSSSRRYLTDERTQFIELDFDDEEKLIEQLRPHRFDYVVHAAGVTKCTNHADFFRVNTDGTRHLVNALLRLKMPLKRFVYLSSLSIFGAIRESEPHEDILLTDTPRPNTDYGRSKLQAEAFLQTVKDRLDYVILRPTGVYGPRETDYFLMADSIKKHTDFAAGFSRQDITFVYVSDVVQAVFCAFEHGQRSSAYFLTDGEVYESTTFSDLIIDELGRPWCLRLRAPIWLLHVICWCGERYGRLTGRISALNMDKFHILKQRNWRCDYKTAERELGYKPQVKLAEGVRRSIKWYKENNWL